MTLTLSCFDFLLILADFDDDYDMKDEIESRVNPVEYHSIIHKFDHYEFKKDD